MKDSESAIGNLVDLDAGEVLLPDFVVRQADGLYVDPFAAGLDGGFRAFVERTFAAGAYFADLDYAAFEELLFGEPAAAGAAPRRLAADIRRFAPERRALYRAVKVADDGSAAEYMFEPIEIEVEEIAPVFGPDGSSVVGTQTVRRAVPARLDFDEFVAAMWEKGVRFGIDVPVVRAAIAASQAQRLAVARLRPATPGRDASIEERTDALHRDNAPKILPDGRMDLRQFKNRFPQIAGDVRLLQKLPRVLGTAGHDVAGNRLEPELPKDFDLALQAGLGTRVERGADGEFLVSARDGFIHIDTQNNQLSVMEKIVSHEGVSMKTTGDVALTGSEFEEHGEVQERRVVEGRHMTFHADVYGSIVSRGGNVVLKSNIAGGSASSAGGSIRAEGRASRATLEARGGEVFAEFAEGCTIVGSRVTVNHAVNCDILGEDVVIGACEGCAVAGKRVRIAQSAARKDTETIVALLVPDLTGFERNAGDLETARQEMLQRIAAQDAIIERLRAEPGFAQFLALATTIAKGGAKLSDAHEANWRQTQTRFAPRVREWQAAQQARATAQAKLEALDGEVAANTERRQHAGDGISCAIEAVTGDTLVRRMAYQPDQSVVGGAQARELAAHLREFGASGDRLFWGGAGQFAWRHDKGACDLAEA